jgi:hypothetical protein
MAAQFSLPRFTVAISEICSLLSIEILRQYDLQILYSKELSARAGGGIMRRWGEWID